MSKIPVLEIFGPTIQGEGMVIGKKTMFVRTAGCDYSCSWCDSAFTWDGSAKDEIVQMTAEDIWNRLKEIGGDLFNHVTISGGNPALLKNLNELINLLKQNEIEVALETQGSRWQDWFTQIDDLTISPKPPSSNMSTDFAILDRIIHNLTDHNRLEQTSLKVVIFDEADYQYAKGIGERYPQIPLYLQVGNRDVHGEDIDNLTSTLLNQYEQLIDRVVQDDELNNVRVLPQLHTLVWGNKRGV
ncbi:7-carboxy-7-deazaguanine synthase [Alkalibacillus haloalkaliphilus]|uniref:7-carboxy-7-deazaguanine synthase n=2 Tax=Alkalibacillus haloalkaliphilus TaxID=94136 RepID=A0A511W329_9BACI|nr:7-carboxy-7-deazaguanine synthase [Alkalibacillus haloalkaliphilus]